MIIFHDYFSALFFVTSGSESESVVGRVPPALAQPPGLEVTVLGYYLLFIYFLAPTGAQEVTI